MLQFWLKYVVFVQRKVWKATHHIGNKGSFGEWDWEGVVMDNMIDKLPVSQGMKVCVQF